MRSCALLVFLVAVSTAKRPYEGDQVLTLYPTTNEQVQVIQKLEESAGLVDFWSPKYAIGVHPYGSVDIRVPGDHISEIKALVDKYNVKYEVKIPDVQHLVDNQIKGREKTREQKAHHDYNVYHTVDEILQWTFDVSANHPDLVTREVIGKSFEGRDIVMLTITKNLENPAILLDCGFHAREWVSPAFCQCFTRNLLEGNDPAFSMYLEKLTFHIVPVVNVDGYAFSWTEGNRFWRKTRANYGTECTGVDPNRNCDADWSGPGSSPNPCSDTYYGPSVESEVEVKAIANFIRSKIGIIMAYITVHSYSQLIIYPYSYTFGLTATDEELKKYAEQAAKAIESVYGSPFLYGAGATLLYRAAGGSDDFAYDSGVPLSYTFELRDTGEYGFALPEDQIEPVCIETTAGMRAFADGALEIWKNRHPA